MKVRFQADTDLNQLISQNLPIIQAVEDLILIWEASEKVCSCMDTRACKQQHARLSPSLRRENLVRRACLCRLL